MISVPLGDQRFQAAVASLSPTQFWALQVAFSAERQLRTAYPAKPGDDVIGSTYMQACARVPCPAGVYR